MTASVHATELLLLSVLLQLIVMIGAARLFNGLARQLGQPGVIGEIVAGRVLGPSLFGHFFPETEDALFGHTPSTPIVIISQIGLILLMFQIGTDFAFGELRSGRYRNATACVAVSSVTVPLVLGCGFGWWSAESLARAPASWSTACSAESWSPSPRCLYSAEFCASTV